MQPSRSLASAGSLSRLARRIALLALVTACGSKQPVDLGALPPAPLPTYGLGDSYQFTDGSSDAMISVGGDLIRWQAKNGTYVTARDVLLPRLAWDTGGETGERRFAVGPLELFPLEPGKGVKFNATRTVRQSDATSRSRCRRIGAARSQARQAWRRRRATSRHGASTARCARRRP